jgi:hypothetical protein
MYHELIVLGVRAALKIHSSIVAAEVGTASDHAATYLNHSNGAVVCEQQPPLVVGEHAVRRRTAYSGPAADR